MYSIRSETFANLASRTSVQSLCWLSEGVVSEKKRCQAVSESGGVIAIAKG